jgi:hypothetical protein
MPKQQILPTWLALNNANFPTQSGLQDVRTGQDFPAGGLSAGDYFDVTEKEANSVSALSVGLLHSGRYRLVQLDSSATTANVKTGTVGYLRAGMTVQNAVVSVPGSGGTAGTYNIPIPPGSGGGNGAVVQVVVGSGGTVTSASVLQGGMNYVAPPPVPLTTIPGLTGATVLVQLNSSPNVVTSFDVATAMGSLVRPVVFLNALNGLTPGNYGFVQELGLATVLGAPGATLNANGWVNLLAAGGGAVTTTAPTTSPLGNTIGQAIDAPVAGGLFKCYLTNVPVVQD